MPSPNQPESWIARLPKKYQAEAIKEMRRLEAEAAKSSRNLSVEVQKRKQAETELAQNKATLDSIAQTQDKIASKRLREMAKSHRGQASAVVVATDWHLAEKIDNEAVNGLNEFNLEIADQRLTRLWNRAVFLIEFAKTISKIDEVVILFLGDLISGVIHQDLEQTNQISASDAIILAQDCMATGIDHLRSKLKLPMRIGCTVGNHGRMSHERYIKAEFGHSLEAIAYQNLAKKYAAHDWISFNVSRGYLARMDVQGRSIRYHHGHAIRYMQGIGGPAIPLRKKINSWNISQTPAHQDVLGHLHMRLSDPRFEMSGCLVGYSEFAIRCGIPYEPPTQTLFVIDRKWGKVMSLPIFLEETPTRPDAY